MKAYNLLKGNFPESGHHYTMATTNPSARAHTQAHTNTHTFTEKKKKRFCCCGALRRVRDHSKRFWRCVQLRISLSRQRTARASCIDADTAAVLFSFTYIQFDIFHFVVVFAMTTYRHRAPLAPVFVWWISALATTMALHAYLTTKKERKVKHMRRRPLGEYQTSENLINGMCRI